MTVHRCEAPTASYTARMRKEGHVSLRAVVLGQRSSGLWTAVFPSLGHLSCNRAFGKAQRGRR